MRLTAMRYKTYTWPHNPHTYSIRYERQVVTHKVPFGRYCLQDLGMTGRVLEGEGEFAGEGAYDEFKKLASLFYLSGPGLLIHPLWQTSNAYFTRLQLTQKPLPDYVRYQFTFREAFDGYQEGLVETGAALPGAASPAAGGGTAARHTVIQGDSLWAIAGTYGVTLEALLAANPGIKNPNLISIGQEVAIPG